MKSPSTETNAASSAATVEKILADNIVTTKHSIKLGGKTLNYTVTCGTMVLKEEIEKDGAREGAKQKAEVFFIAYVRDRVSAVEKRPITFSFNGGPGSSSVWLHMGIAGPKRVALDKDGNAPPPPHVLVENEFTLLDETDLVFIDPVGTGYSRMADGEKSAAFHEHKRDTESVGEFIRMHTSRYGRWASPKFLLGESYGTTRATSLSNYLFDRYGMSLNGLMLVSVAMDFHTLDFDHNNDLPPVLFLPTYAATAWYHKRLDKSLQAKSLRALMDEVEAFALGEYASALLQGNRLSANARAAVIKKLARYTSLSEAYIAQTNLRINIHRFCKALLRDEARTVGRLDSRFAGVDRDAAGAETEFDVSYANILGAYSTCLNRYLGDDLKFTSDLPYEILKPLYDKWGWEEFVNRYVSTSEALRSAMSKNQHMKAFVANGYYDLATPHLASDYTFSHLAIAPQLEKNISVAYYEAGHMMYIHAPSLRALSKDLHQFIRRSVE
jgi:carboxypeptidase C (cathepsin A)